MKSRILAALLTLFIGAPCLAQEQARPNLPPVPRPASPDFSPRSDVPLAKQAEDFIAQVEAQLAALNEHSNRLGWVAATYINDDTDWLVAKLSAEMAALSVKHAKAAARYDHVDVDPVVRRKLDILKKSLVLPTPDRPGAAEELADIGVRLSTRYATVQGRLQGQGPHARRHRRRLAHVARSRRAQGTVGRMARDRQAMRADYARQTDLANEGARELGHADTGVLWRSWYDMPPDEFARTADRLWSQVAPMYKNLQCYARARLNEKYGDAVQPRSGPIRADLLGDMWAQSWGNIYDLMAPKDASLGYDLTAALEKQELRRDQDREDRREFLHLARLYAAAANVLGALDARRARAIARSIATPRPGTSTTRTTCASRPACASTPTISTPRTTSSGTTSISAPTRTSHICSRTAPMTDFTRRSAISSGSMR